LTGDKTPVQDSASPKVLRLIRQAMDNEQ